MRAGCQVRTGGARVGGIQCRAATRGSVAAGARASDRRATMGSAKRPGATALSACTSTTAVDASATFTPVATPGDSRRTAREESDVPPWRCRCWTLAASLLASVCDTTPTEPPSPAHSNAVQASRVMNIACKAVRAPVGPSASVHSSDRVGADSTWARRTVGIFTGRTIRPKYFGFS